MLKLHFMLSNKIYVSSNVVFHLLSHLERNHIERNCARLLLKKGESSVTVLHMYHYWVKKQETVFLLCFWATIFYLTQNWLRLIFFVINIFNYFAWEIKPDEKCSTSRRPIRFIAAGQMQATNSKSCRLNIICVLEPLFLSFFSVVCTLKITPELFFLDMDVLEFHDLTCFNQFYVARKLTILVQIWQKNPFTM